MEKKVYSSYKEIEQDLEILKLQKEIDAKKLSLSFEKTIELFTPVGIMQNILGNAGTWITKSGVLKNMVLPYIINKIMK
jgi:hypothetical protein